MPVQAPKKGRETEDQFLFVNAATGPNAGDLLRSRKSQVSLRERRHAAKRSLGTVPGGMRQASRQAPPTKLPVGWDSNRHSLLAIRESSWIESTEHETNREEEGPLKNRQGARSRRDAAQQNVAQRLPLTICFHNDAVDPFNTTATGVDSWTHKVVQYYVYKMIPDVFIAESKRSCPQPEQFNLAISARVHDCLSNELHMYAMMASCSSRMRRFECVRTLSRRNSPEYCVAQAVSVLRRKLSANLTTLDPATFLGIVSLCSAETYMGNHEAAAIHLRLINHLGREMGGFTKFDAYLVELFSVVDVNLAIDADSLPILPLEVHEWKQDSVPAQRLAEVISCAMTSGLPALEPGTLPGWDNEFFSSEMIQIVHDLAVYLQAAQYIWDQPHSMPRDRKWIFLRGLGIVYRLLSLKNRSAFSPSPQPEIEECCRISLLLLTHAITSHVRARQFVKAWAPRFKDALVRSMGPESRWHERPGIFLWVLSMGIFIAEGTDEEQWFLAEAAATAASSGVSAPDAYASFIQTFFMLDDGSREDLLKMSGVLEWQQDNLMSH